MLVALPDDEFPNVLAMVVTVDITFKELHKRGTELSKIKAVLISSWASSADGGITVVSGIVGNSWVCSLDMTSNALCF